MPKLSPWFKDEPPVHNGVYQRDIHNNKEQTIYAYFFEGTWYAFAPTIKRAFQYAKDKSVSGFQGNYIKWRGIV